MSQSSRTRPGLLSRRRWYGSRSLVVLAACLLMAVALMSWAGDAFPGGTGPQAVIAAADPTVGVVFTDPVAPTHQCTGSVLVAGHGLVLTAAHCLKGTGAGMRFIPGYDGAAAEPAPFGTWTVSKVWVAAGWLAAREPAHDFAILQVGDQPVGGEAHSIEQVTGGHVVSMLGRTVNDVVGPSLGPVTVVAYNAGSGDAPVTCTIGRAADPVPAAFGCGGFSGGTSGAPWMQKGAVKGPSRLVGIIGGPHQGGCSDSVSYSPTFDDQMVQVLARAEQDQPGDDVPAAGDDGC